MDGAHVVKQQGDHPTIGTNKDAPWRRRAPWPHANLWVISIVRFARRLPTRHTQSVSNDGRGQRKELKDAFPSTARHGELPFTNSDIISRDEFTKGGARFGERSRPRARRQRRGRMRLPNRATTWRQPISCSDDLAPGHSVHSYCQ
jgi:hypothetical protein